MCNPPYNVSISQLIPARIDSEKQKKIEHATNKLLNLVGYKFGPAHIEMVINDNSVKIVEIQTRPGGRIHEMLKYALGINIFEMTINKLFQKEYRPKNKNESSKACALFYLIPYTKGKVIDINGIEEISKHPSVKNITLNIKEGDVVESLRNTSGRKGHIIVTGENPTDTYLLGKELVNKIKIETEN